MGTIRQSIFPMFCPKVLKDISDLLSDLLVRGTLAPGDFYVKLNISDNCFL